MGLINSILAYEREEKLLERALNAEKGIRISYDSEREAIHIIHRCNKFRALDRRRNREIYSEPANVMHGASVYDRLSIKREGFTVKIEKLPQTEQALVEDL